MEDCLMAEPCGRVPDLQSQLCGFESTLVHLVGILVNRWSRYTLGEIGSETTVEGGFTNQVDNITQLLVCIIIFWHWSLLLLHLTICFESYCPPWTLLCQWQNYRQQLATGHFPSVFWHCWLGDRKGIRPVKKLGVGLLVMIWLELCTSYSYSCQQHFHHP